MLSLFVKIPSQQKVYNDLIKLRTNVISDALCFKNIVVPPSLKCMTQLGAIMDCFEEIKTVEDFKEFMPEIIDDLKSFQEVLATISELHHVCLSTAS